MPRTVSPAFVGRSAELASMQAALARASARQASTVLLSGEAGIGKTRLLEEFVASAREGGATVLIGGCPAILEGGLPFAAIVEALRTLVRQLSEADLDEVAGPARGQLARLHPAFASAGETGDGAADLDSAQTYLFEGILGTLERLGDLRGPAVLVIEDLQWVDRSTRELLAFLVRNLRDAPVLLVGSFRPEAVPTGNPLRALFAEFERAGNVQRVELPRFGRAEVREQLAAIVGGEPDADLVEEVDRRADGNPFFAEELAAAIVAGAGDGLPSTLREVLLAGLVALPAEIQEVLRMAAVAGRRFDPRIIAAATNLDEAVFIAVLREAVRLQLFATMRDGDRELFEFSHGLLREAIYDDIVPVERSRRHALIAAVAANAPGLLVGTAALRDATMAHHWLAANDPARALPALLRAGFAAEEAYAFAEAADAFENALRIMDDGVVAGGTPAAAARRPIGFRDRASDDAPVSPDGPDRAEVIRHAAEAACLTGSPGRAAELTRELVALLDPAAEPLVASLAQERLGRYLWDDGDADGALASYERAAHLALAAPASADQVRVLGSQARALVNAGRFGDARAAAEQAIEIGRSIGAESEVRRVRATLGVALAYLGEVEEGLKHLVAARERVRERTSMSMVRPRPSRIGEVVRGFADLAAVLERTGRSGEAAAVSMEGSALARELGVETTWGSTLEIHAALGRFHMGEWDDAERMTRRLLAGGVRGAPAARLHLVRARLELGRGAFDDAVLHLEAARIHLPTRAEPALLGDLAAATAELALWRAQLTDARAAIDDGLCRLHEAEDQLPIAELCWLGVRAEADRSEATRARRVPAELAQAREVAASLRAELIGTARRLEGQASLAPRELRVFPAFLEAEWTRLEAAPDPDRWALAADLAGEVGDPWLVAYARWREGEAALELRGEKSRAEKALRESYAAAVALGGAPLIGELEALGRRARVDVVGAPDAAASEAPAPATPAAAEAQRFGLTTREIEVLALVAEGRTNRQIADELFITEKTAGHHVSNVLGKLGVASRVEAAAVAHRLGMLQGSSSASS